MSKTKAPLGKSKQSPVEFTYNHGDFRVAAILAHKDQKYGDLPYAYHLALVENMLYEHDYHDYDMIAAAWLHDALEDTKATFPGIATQYNVTVATLVWACTGEGATRRERNECIYKRLADIPEAAPIKCADRLANLTYAFKTDNLDKMKMYLDEWPMYKKRVSPLMLESPDRRRAFMWSNLEDMMDKIKDYYEYATSCE